MKLAIMQPYLFPYVGYYQLVNAADRFVVYDDVNFINRGWINRNNILINGKASLFSVPLKKASQNKLICEIQLGEDPWRPELLKKIELAYKKAPHYNNIFPMVVDIISGGHTHIAGLALSGLTTISAYLGFTTVFVNSSSVYNNRDINAQYRILDICRQENAATYINPIGGTEIYSKELFGEAGIKLQFLRTGNVAYRQYANDFVPNLSILDLLMFNSKEEIKLVMDNYELI